MFNAISLIVSLIGAIGSVILIYEWIILVYIKKNLKWLHVERGVNNVISFLESKGFAPDVVVCLGRGGCVFGGLIAGNIGLVRICALDRIKVSTPDEAISIPKFLINPNLNELSNITPNKKFNILLVTGEVVTGFDLINAKNHLNKECAEKLTVDFEIISVSFTSLEHANYLPDYSYKSNLRYYRIPPWRKNEKYINDRRANKTFHNSSK